MSKDHDKDDGHKGGHGGHGAHGGGGHGDGEHEGAPEWLISFADNVMLQMGFFVILLALNMGIKAKGPSDAEGPGTGGGGTPTEMLDFAIAVRAGFNNPVDMGSTDPADQVLIRRMMEKRGAGQSRQPEDAGTGRENQAIIPTERSSLGGHVAFEDDSETLTSRGVTRVEEIAARIKGMRWVIEVRGHSSPSEAGLDQERASTLGYKRALAVAKVLAESGVRWEQMRIGSAGASDRRTGRQYDREADRANQRVEIIVTGEAAPGENAGVQPESR